MYYATMPQIGTSKKNETYSELTEKKNLNKMQITQFFKLEHKKSASRLSQVWEQKK